MYNDDYQHLRCDCGGIVGQWNIRFGFECEKCHKDYNNYSGFDYLLRNDMTGWIFPMVKKIRSVRKMAEYIEREAVINQFESNGGYFTYGKTTVKAIVSRIKMQPAADVEPIKHGCWICIGDIDEYIFECSECHEIYYLNDGTPKEHQYNYCPNCGAKLCKGEENNA